MPTINEVWEQALLINANLGTVHHDLEALTTVAEANGQRLDAVVGLLGEVRDTINAGFGAVATAIDGMADRQNITNRLLVHQVEQVDTVICLLDHIARNTCTLVNDSADIVSLQRQLVRAGDGIEHMVATAAPAAGVALERARAAADRMSACCPPEASPPPCEYQPCPSPEPLVDDGIKPWGTPASGLRRSG